MRVNAPAKINLHLRVGPLRADGFHPLMSWMCTVGLFDSLRFEGAGGPGIHLTVDRPSRGPLGWRGESADHERAGTHDDRNTSADGTASNDGSATGPDVVPVDATNLVTRAVAIWESSQAASTGTGEGSPGGHSERPIAPVVNPGWTIHLQKRIPVGAGLGGGSSDAACTLGALNAMAGQPLSRAQLAELGSRLGSDVPFFFFAPSAVCTGRGEIVRPIAAPTVKWAALFLPGIHVSTPAVYRQFDAMGLGKLADIEVEPDWAMWTKLPARELMAQLVNDLEAPAFVVCPELAEIQDRLQKNMNRVVRMSGSGSSLFTLFDTKNEARFAVASVRLPIAFEVVPVGPVDGSKIMSDV